MTQEFRDRLFYGGFGVVFGAMSGPNWVFVLSGVAIMLMAVILQVRAEV